MTFRGVEVEAENPFSNRSNAFAVSFCCSGARDLRRQSSTHYCLIYFLEIVLRSFLLMADD
jgi:hypothetical protein